MDFTQILLSLIVVGIIILIGIFNDKDKDNSNGTRKTSIWPTGLSIIEDKYKSIGEVQNALREAGLEASNLILGIDYTKSNEYSGQKVFGGPMHTISTKLNPYQQVIKIVGKTLKPFDEDNLIPTFGFGDILTKDKSVFPFYPDRPCYGFEEVLSRYNEITPGVQLSGPTNFAPLIHAAINIVREQKEYHILVIIADGQVTNEQETINAIVEASKYPLSIIMVGVGDGPWDAMKNFDDGLPQRKFDNFQFVNFHEVVAKAETDEHAEIMFAVSALQEIPDQYKEIKRLHLFDIINNGMTVTASPGVIIFPAQCPTMHWNNQGEYFIALSNLNFCLPRNVLNLLAMNLTFNFSGTIQPSTITVSPPLGQWYDVEWISNETTKWYYPTSIYPVPQSWLSDIPSSLFTLNITVRALSYGYIACPVATVTVACSGTCNLCLDGAATTRENSGYTVVTTNPLTTRGLPTNSGTTEVTTFSGLTTSRSGSYVISTNAVTTLGDQNGVTTLSSPSTSGGRSSSSSGRITSGILASSTTASESSWSAPITTEKLPVSTEGNLNSASNENRSSVVGAIVGGLLGIAIIAMVIGVFARRKKRENSKRQHEEVELAFAKNSSDKISDNIPSTPKQISSSGWEIDYKELEIGNELGRGVHGVVYKAIWRGTLVAVKCVITDSMSEKQLQSFQKEIKVMEFLRPHPNVVMLYGISRNPVSIITEFVDKGSLYGYLRSDEKIGEQIRDKIIIGIARGMNHLHLENIVHRDLAARNVLLTSHYEPKITDFGLSRNTIIDGNVTQATVGPIKWMAPESLEHRTYSSKSDVWSFAIVIIEVLTRDKPFPTMEATQVGIKVSKRLLKPEAPESAPAKLKEIIHLCTNFEPEERPNFPKIVNMLSS